MFQGVETVMETTVRIEKLNYMGYSPQKKQLWIQSWQLEPGQESYNKFSHHELHRHRKSHFLQSLVDLYKLGVLRFF